MKTIGLLVCLLTILLSGCGGGGGDGGIINPPVEPVKAPVTLNLSIPENILSQLPAQANTMMRATADNEAGLTIKVTVTGEGMYESTETFNYTPAATYSKQIFVVVGTNRTFKVDVFDTDGTTIILTGSNTANVTKDQPNSVKITLEPPKTGVDVGVIIHEINGPPKIRFTSVPAYGSFDNISGAVDNCAPKDCKVIVMIHAWIGWWVKPYNDRPYTMVKPDGTWECDYTTGGIDQTADEIRAYLVTSDYIYSDMPDDINDPKVLDMVSVTRTPE